MENTVMAEEAAPEITETVTEMAKDSDTVPEIAKDSDTTAETAKDSDTTAETAKDSDTMAETAKNSDTVAETAKDSDAVAETAKDSNTVAETAKDSEAAEDMELEPHDGAGKSENGGESGKRGREEGEEQENEEDGGGAKKQKVEKSVEEERLEKSETAPAAPEKTGPVTVGAKTFGTSLEIFDYFYKLLHFWSPNININKYEHMMLLDLLKKGHEKKIGNGIRAFQVRYHPQWKSRCYFLVREDGSCDDFSFRKCVDHILPLPESMQIKSDVNKALGGGKGGGRGNWRGRGGHGRGGKR